MIASNLELHRMATKRKSRVITALTMLKSHLFKYQGHIGAALVLGGFDLNGRGGSGGAASRDFVAFSPHCLLRMLSLKSQKLMQNRMRI